MRLNGPPIGGTRVTSASMSAAAEGSAESSASAGLNAPKRIEVAASHDLSKCRHPFGIAALTLRQFLLAAPRMPRGEPWGGGASRSHPVSSWLHDDLPIHPGMRRTDVVVDPGLHEADSLRLAFGQRAGGPLALLERPGIVR